jgi:hypothetical protein
LMSRVEGRRRTAAIALQSSMPMRVTSRSSNFLRSARTCSACGRG